MFRQMGEREKTISHAVLSSHFLRRAGTELEGDSVDPYPRVSVRHRSSGRLAAGNDDGFAQRSPIFLLPYRIHRP